MAYSFSVMPGLDPGIQKAARRASGLDRRVKPGDDSFLLAVE